MKVLIVEDEVEKAKALKKFLDEEHPSVTYNHKGSFNTALREIEEHHEEYDLIFLDMTMNTFDKSSEDYGGAPQILAGERLLDSMYLQWIQTPVVVVSMYGSFDGVKMADLHKRLKKEYPENYLGHVHFALDKTDWKNELSHYIEKIVNGKTENTDNR